MKNIQLIGLTLIPIILGLSFLLVKGIYDNISEIKDIKIAEGKVINKLKLIRKAQKAYHSKYNTYASDWNTLINFIKKDTYYNVSVKEHNYEVNGVEFTKYEYDTLSSSKMLAHIFPINEYPYIKVDQLPFISEVSNKKFDLYTSTINKGGVNVNVIEVVNPFPVDKKRNESNLVPQRRFLRFGSRSEITLNGNWK